MSARENPSKWLGNDGEIVVELPGGDDDDGRQDGEAEGVDGKGKGKAREKVKARRFTAVRGTRFFGMWPRYLLCKDGMEGQVFEHPSCRVRKRLSASVTDLTGCIVFSPWGCEGSQDWAELVVSWRSMYTRVVRDARWDRGCLGVGGSLYVGPGIVFSLAAGVPGGFQVQH